MELNQIQFKSLCNLDHGNMLYFNHTSEAYHTHFKMIQIDQTMSHETWISLNSNWSLNLHFKCNILHLNGIASHIKAYTSSFILQPCVCALYLYCFLVCCLSSRGGTGTGGCPLR